MRGNSEGNHTHTRTRAHDHPPSNRTPTHPHTFTLVTQERLAAHVTRCSCWGSGKQTDVTHAHVGRPQCHSGVTAESNPTMDVLEPIFAFCVLYVCMVGWITWRLPLRPDQHRPRTRHRCFLPSARFAARCHLGREGEGAGVDEWASSWATNNFQWRLGNSSEA